MQLWINTVNNNVLENIESILYSDDRNLAKWFMQNLPGEIYEKLSPQYEYQVMSGMQIRKLLGGNVFKNIKGFYYGTEQCEYLLPTVEETKKAVQMIKEFDKKYVSKDVKQFVFVTPYYGNLQVRERLIENLEYLNESAKYINKKSGIVEVVVNDFGTIKLLKNYDNLKPVMGRILVKTLKNPIVDTFGIEKNLHIAGESMKNKSQDEINEIKHEVAQNQNKAYERSGLNNPFYNKFLDKNSVTRAGIDYQQGKQGLYKDVEKDMDLYYPYSLIFVGRLCDTSAIDNIKRGYYPIDEVCNRTCWKYDMNINDFETVGYKIIQRGNAQYRSNIELELPQECVDKYDNRLIYTPLI